MRFVFGDHVLDAGRRELSRGGFAIALEPQVFDLLLYLLRNRERMVSKDDVLDSVWHGRIVSESSLTSRINAARKAVGDSGEAQSVIRTVPRKGFRFVAEVREEAVGPLPVPELPPIPASPFAAPVDKPLLLPEMPSIAVLPFNNLSGNPEQDYFGDGLVEDITTALSRLRWLFVIARNSAFTYKGRAVDIRQVGRELGVRYVLEGSVRTAGGRIRVTGQLIEAESGKHIWAERYDRAMDDIFALQDEITQRVVATIEPSIYAEEGYRAQLHIERPAAWGLVMRALSLINRLHRTEAHAAMKLLMQAVEIDPANARAHALIAWAYLIGGQCGWYVDAELTEPSARHAQAAMRLDPDEAWSRMAYAFWLSSVFRHSEALALARQMVEAAPSFALGRGMFAWMLTRAGFFDEAVLQAEHTQRLSPVGTYAGFYSWIHGFTLMGAKRFEESSEAYWRSLAEFPDWSGALNGLISVNGHLGQVERIQPLIARLRIVAPHYSIAMLRKRLTGHAHTEIMIEGLIKCGLPE
ncbi:winged helix-turn-helix domain-containing tetratricopeptide repeat protein [Bosea vaviloviae]|uniref:OmpR/PhoB-type domain-containing protein n=1 Tax=Bosea vaviloviae TaxID=1526658 RepID=A0A1D7U826_9HYPH|nr:winged helix-turn-helix domain-containing tetratricopeptide repeat protein [Bosea vaviloviae]AOO83484.1 hypothetical protein BHK69_26295 [Bosea vaviloviae]